MSKAETTDTTPDDDLHAMLQACRLMTVDEQSAYLAECLWQERAKVAARRAALATSIRLRGMH
ncbi:hypothetical protein FV228_04475 [Methylobacterium sp. WL18]|uniref:hypothetical protein n=1 Tax=Methylobacterium sp. WL18 TaxID=2603897 RepID=UPI0011C952F0|nr:hypothetical protein [Methylobacterium sp. WL18]TXN75119.1 hypothetical protein FV228_04475 [Methylobacterium sp. WL18]